MGRPETTPTPKLPITRRTLLASSAATGLIAVSSPPIISARGEAPVKIGWIDPLSGTYAALGKSQVNGAHMALAEINKKGGILGRQVEILVQDGAANVGQSVDKLNELVDKDQVNFTAGSVSSAVAQACSHAANLKNILYVAVGGHVDTVTGSDCYWNTFKTCSDTWMLAKAVSGVLLKKFGKRWYFSTPDYAWGHFLYKGFSEILAKAGGTNLGNALMPLGSTDFSSVLIKVEQAKPDVLIVLQGGDDLVNVMKQASQFGLTKKMAFGYGLIELEDLAALPEEARLGWGVMEWWWDQPNQPHVAGFVDQYRKLYSRTASARSWLGYISTHAIAMAAAKAKSLDSVKVSHALAGMHFPPEIALEPNNPYYRAGDHQCMITEFVGQVNSKGKYPDLFTVADEIAGDTLAQTPAQKGCKMSYSTAS
jgi:branched-chain amino acid transport system substrate-binding protein